MKSPEKPSVPTVGLIFMLAQKNTMKFIQTVLTLFTCLRSNFRHVSAELLMIDSVNQLMRENSETGGNVACY